MTAATYPLFVCLTAMATAAAAMAFDGVDLANLREWTIVVADDAIESERYAASELQRFYQQASGVELPIVSTTDRADRHIFVGSGAAMRASNVGFDTSSMGEEALRIIVTPNNIAIAGGRPRGTLYGVYTFLEDYLGVRFLTPDHNHVPPVGDSRPVAAVDRTYDPPIVFRWSYWHATNEHPDFAARMRCNAVANGRPELGDISRHQLINHSLHHWINTKEFGKTHPEYFALVEGQRRADVNGGDSHYYGTQPCMTHPDVIRIITERVLAKLGAQPDTAVIQLGQGDNVYYCRCDTCAAIDEREESHMGSLLTGVNAVAEAVGREFPEVKIGTLAYSYSIRPPKTLRARENVVIQVCNIGASVTKVLTDTSSARNAEFAADLRRWRERASHISIWTYSTNFYDFLLPAPTLHIWGPNMRYYVDHGVNQMFVQGNRQSPGGAFSDVTNYVIGRLLWNPSLDGEALVDEFLTLHYGNAAAPMRRYLDLRVERYAAANLDQYCNGNAKSFGIDDKMVQAGLDAYEQALTLADDDAVRQRLDLFKLWVYRAAIDEAWAPINPWGKSPRQPSESVAEWLVRLGHPFGCVDADVQRRTQPYVRDVFALIGQYNVTHWRENMPVSVAEAALRHGFGLAEGEAW